VTVPEFTVPLFFDTYEKQTDVRVKTEQIGSLVMPIVKGKDTQRPPNCLFLWGDFSYRGIVSKVDQRFTMFLESGIPVRAELTVTFKKVETLEEEAKLKSRTESRKFWQVKSGERLDLIAHRALKDPAQWRKIAELNNITDPLTFPMEDDIGRMLIIPE
jgi:nucleoid-associated protein YgaU